MYSITKNFKQICKASNSLRSRIYHPFTYLYIYLFFQSFLITQLEHWLDQNRMFASHQKSTVTLLTPGRHESNSHAHVTQNDHPPQLNKTPSIIGITQNTHHTLPTLQTST